MRESRTSGSVRAKAEWLSYSTEWFPIAFPFTEGSGNEKRERNHCGGGIGGLDHIR
jgi:hypothetical protein